MKRLILLFALASLFSLKLQANEESRKNKNTKTDKGISFIYYKINKGESLNGIARIFHIPIREIAKHNNDVYSTFGVGQILKIPRINKHIFPHFISYTAKQGEGLQSIFKKFKTSEEELKLFNPEVNFKLIVGHELKLPTEYYKAQKVKIKSGAESKLGKRKNNYSISFANIDKSIFFTPNYFISKETESNLKQSSKQIVPYKIAIFLPFYISENLQDTLSSKIVFKKNSDKIVEFYQGVLMAVDSIRRTGMKIELSVFDTEKSDEKIKEILKKADFSKFDLFIGPAYNSQIKIIAEFAQKNNINLVSPLTPNTDILAFNEKIFQIKPSQESQIGQVAKYLSLYWDKNLVVAHNGLDEDLDFTKIFKKKMSLYFANLSGRDTISFKEYNSKSNEGVSIESSLSNTQENFIIVPSTNETYVINLLNRLNTLSSKYRIVVFGMPEWQRFTNLELEQIHRLQLHYFSNYFIEHEAPNVIEFSKKYAKVFGGEPDQFGYQGYDITLYFLNKLKIDGKTFDKSISDLRIAPEKPGLQSQFKFERISPTGGYINTSLFIIRHTKDFEFTKLDPSVRIEYFKESEILPED